jgi:septum formation protein
MLSVVRSKKLILASSSPRRRELLTEVGLKFDIQVSAVDETELPLERAQEMVLRLAKLKAETIAKLEPAAWVLGADTTVVLDNQILGKPESNDDAFRMLKLIQGRRHQVWGGVALVCLEQGVLETQTLCSEVTIGALSDLEIRAYVETLEPMDKAGSYAIQGIGSVFVERINGSYTNVVGLAIPEVIGMLRRHCVLELGGLKAGALKC